MHRQRNEAWEKWILSLANCPRIGLKSPHEFTGDVLPVEKCNCRDCELWRKANHLQDEYRRLCGFPV